MHILYSDAESSTIMYWIKFNHMQMLGYMYHLTGAQSRDASAAFPLIELDQEQAYCSNLELCHFVKYHS